jgi:small neutral amino acid transporter SnatA (MarC family)
MLTFFLVASALALLLSWALLRLAARADRRIGQREYAERMKLTGRLETIYLIARAEAQRRGAK